MFLRNSCFKLNKGRFDEFSFMLAVSGRYYIKKIWKRIVFKSLTKKLTFLKQCLSFKDSKPSS